MKRKKLYQTLAIIVVFLFAGAPPSAMGNRSVFCGESQVCTLWGGKTIDVGTVSISNDEENLYVKYEATGDWYSKEVHLYVLGYEPTERLKPGLAPFKSGDLSYAKDCTFTLPLNEFEEVVCGETALWLQAHASAVKILNNEVVQEETAYACDITAEANPWYGNAMYTVQCCQDVTPPCYEFTGETASGAGTRYVSKGNWATYTPCVPGSTANLYAGQTMNAGTVTFSPVVNSKVTITINLTGDWEFAQVEENVKIQDYATAPSTKPSPGRFRWKNTASGKSFSIDVPANSDYGVHADVGYWKEVHCPLD